MPSGPSCSSSWAHPALPDTGDALAVPLSGYRSSHSPHSRKQRGRLQGAALFYSPPPQLFGPFQEITREHAVRTEPIQIVIIGNGVCQQLIHPGLVDFRVTEIGNSQGVSGGLVRSDRNELAVVVLGLDLDQQSLPVGIPDPVACTFTPIGLLT